MKITCDQWLSAVANYNSNKFLGTGTSAKKPTNSNSLFLHLPHNFGVIPEVKTTQRKKYQS